MATLRKTLLHLTGITFYLCLPLGIYLLILRQHYPVGFLAYFFVHFLVVMVLLGVEGMLPQKWHPWYGTGLILGLWSFIDTLELALKDYYGVPFSSQVLYHFNWLSIKITFLQYWFPLALFGLATVCGWRIFYRYRIRTHQVGLGPTPSYSAVLVPLAFLAMITVPAPLRAALPPESLLMEMVNFYSPAVRAIYQAPQPQLLRRFGIVTDVKPVSELRVIKPPHPHNLILIYIEGFDLGFTQMGHSVYGDLTPNLDAFARRSTSLTNYYSSEGFTIAGLVASQCGILPDIDSSSQMRARVNYYKNLPALGNVLHQAGYYQIYMNGASKIWSGKDRFFITHQYDETHGWEEWEKNPRYQKKNNHWGLYDKDLFQEALRQIERLQTQKPFNLTLLTLDTHAPGLPEPDMPPYRINNAYLQSIRSTDRSIGWFIQELERRHLMDDTTVIITADHRAVLSNEHKRLFGEKVDEKIPLIIRTPDHRLPAVVSMLGYTPDLAPTLLDVLGIRMNTVFVCGKSIFDARRYRMGILRDPASGTIEPLLFAHGLSGAGAIDARPASKNPADAYQQIRRYLSFFAQQFHADE